MHRWIITLILLTSCFTLQAEATPPRGIVNIQGDLYRFRNDAHYGVFLVTNDGIITTDPVNADTAGWLKSELKTRFGKHVTYLIYSHHHADHASGGEVFADTAVFVAHKNAVAGFKERQVPTALPDITFTDRMTIKHGGKIVELTYAGLSHSDDSIIIHFPEERAVYAVDFVLAKALPYQDLPLWAYFYPAWLDALIKLEKMDFDILIPGHDQVGTHADVRLFRHYLEDLETAVKAAIDQGQSMEEAEATIKLDQYSSWDLYDEWFALNVRGMYRQLTTQADVNGQLRTQ